MLQVMYSLTITFLYRIIISTVHFIARNAGTVYTHQLFCLQCYYFLSPLVLSFQIRRAHQEVLFGPGGRRKLLGFIAVVQIKFSVQHWTIVINFADMMLTARPSPPCPPGTPGGPNTDSPGSPLSPFSWNSQNTLNEITILLLTTLSITMQVIV